MADYTLQPSGTELHRTDFLLFHLAAPPFFSLAMFFDSWGLGSTVLLCLALLLYSKKILDLSAAWGPSYVEFCVFSLGLLGFSLGALASFHSSNTDFVRLHSLWRRIEFCWDRRKWVTWQRGSRWVRLTFLNFQAERGILLIDMFNGSKYIRGLPRQP